MDKTLSLLFAIIVTVAGIGMGFHWLSLQSNKRDLSDCLNQVQSQISQQPDKSKPAWDLARLTLDAYFQRNINQISYIFWLSACVMGVGFGTVIWGISKAMESSTLISLPDASSNSIAPEVLASLAGIITQFIGVSFLAIYRSVIQQAASYSEVLERINSIGMAMQIMDTMPDEVKTDDLKSQTKATIVKFLVDHSYTLSVPTTDTSTVMSSSSGYGIPIPVTQPGSPPPQ